MKITTILQQGFKGEIQFEMLFVVVRFGAVCVMEKQTFDVAFIYFAHIHKILSIFFRSEWLGVIEPTPTANEKIEMEEADVTMHSITSERGT